MQRYIFPLLIIISLVSDNLSGQSPIVNTQYGPVAGSMNEAVFEFLGIPFASPPVGELRWQPPVPPESWSEVLPAQDYGPKCAQKSFTQGDTTSIIEGSEDCLYLNIWTPDTVAANLPVMVFIHGGGNQQGSASDFTLGTEIYNGKNLSQRGNVVVVTIQYRLGPLGFLVHPGLEAESSQNTSGNYAVMDQLLALEWVQNNISQFGGDASKVMIFGESAGGVNVGNLMTTPFAAGLFSRACIQSASPNLQEYEMAKTNGMDFADGFINSGTDAEKVTYLRSLDPEMLIANLESPVSGGVVQSKWKPVLDHYIFTDTPINIFQSGNFNKVPLIIGSNADEMSLSAPLTVFPFTVDILINLYIPLELRPLAHELYPSGTTNAEARDAYVQLLTDGQFTVNARRTARCVSQNQEAAVYRYFFTHTHAGFLGDFGAYHGIDLFYGFNNWENSSLAIGPFYTAQDDSVQNNMLKYWVNFASTGNPNGNNLVEWPAYQSDADCYLNIKATPDGSQCGLRTEKSDFWDAVIGFEGCTTSVASNDISEAFQKWTVFPNPTNGSIVISTDQLPSSFEICIFDATGRLLIAKKNETEFDLSPFPGGLYYITINNNEQLVTQKLIKW